MTNKVVDKLEEMIKALEDMGNEEVTIRILKCERERLNNELLALKAQLEKAESVIEWYSEKENWYYYDIYSWSTGDSSPKYDTECLENCGKVGSKYYGGKRAREYFANKKDN